MKSRTLFSWLMAYSAAGDFPENFRRLFLDQPQGVAVGVADHHRLLETELGLRLRRYGHHARADERHARLRSEEHTSELQSLRHLVCRLLLEKKKKPNSIQILS